MRLPDIFSHAFTKYVLALALAMIAFSISLPVSGPAHFPDEVSYLMNAAAIAGYPNDMASSYHAGYSLLITPAFLLGNEPDSVWFSVKLINSFLYFLMVVFLFHLAAEFFPNAQIGERGIAVITTSIYPFFFIMPGYSLSETTFITFFMLSLIFFNKVLSGSGTNSLFFGITTGYLYWIHPKALPVIIAGFISLFYISFRLRKASLVFYYCLGSIMTLVLYKQFFMPWLNARMTISGLPAGEHYPQIRDVFTNLGSVSELKEFIGRYAGHLFYLVIGPIGLVMIGIYYLWNKSKHAIFNTHKISHVSIETANLIFLSLSVLGIMTLSVLSFTYQEYAPRLDHWMYGRYTEGVIAPLILIAIISILTSHEQSITKKQVFIIAALGVFSGLILWFLITPFMPTCRPNVSTFWQDFFIRSGGVMVWLIAGLIPIFLLYYVKPRIGVFMIFLIFIFCCLTQTVSHINTANAQRLAYSSASYIRQHYPEETLIGFDYAGKSDTPFFFKVFAFTLYDYSFRRMSLTQWEKEPTALFFSHDTNVVDGKIIIFHSPNESPFLLSH